MFQKPNKKNATSVFVQALCLGAGIKLGDGLAAIAPESTESYKNWLIGASGLLLAMCVNPSTSGGKALQSAVLGVGVSGFVNGISEVISPSVPVQDNTTLAGRFVNAVVGHKPADIAAAAQDAAALNAPWEPSYEVASEWERPQVEERNIQIALG